MAKQRRPYPGPDIPTSNAFTPQGTAERLDRFFWGLGRQRGWRGGVARAFALLALLVIAGLVVAGIVHAAGG